MDTSLGSEKPDRSELTDDLAVPPIMAIRKATTTDATPQPDQTAITQPSFGKDLDPAAMTRPEINLEVLSPPSSQETYQASVLDSLVTSLETSPSDKSDHESDTMVSPQLPATDREIVNGLDLICNLDMPVSIDDGSLATSVEQHEQASDAAISTNGKRKIQSTSGLPEDTDSGLSDPPADLSDCSVAPLPKKPKIEPTPPIPVPVMRTTRNLHRPTSEEIATEELVRTLSSRRSARIAKAKGGLAQPAVAKINKSLKPIKRASKKVTTMKSGLNITPTEKRLTRRSAAVKQADQISKSNDAADSEDVISTLQSSFVTPFSTEAIATQRSSDKGPTRRKTPNRMAKAKQGNKREHSRIVILKLTPLALGHALGLSPVSITASPLGGTIRTPMSTPPRIPVSQFPLTPDDTPRRDMVSNLDISRLPWSTTSPSNRVSSAQSHALQMYPSPMYQPPICRPHTDKSAQPPFHDSHQTCGSSELQQQVDVLGQSRSSPELLQQMPTHAPQRSVLQPAWPKDLLTQFVQQHANATQEISFGEPSLHEAPSHELPRRVWPTDRRDHSLPQARSRAALCSNNGSTAPKPEPLSTPEVWADGRQELCETLPYFRAYHGGSYTTGGFARGFMFDKSAHTRDYMDSVVVIARAGGGLVMDKNTGERVIGGDRSEDSKVASLRNSMQYLNPVVIIVGADNPNAPTKPPHAYCVLDYFKPTHIWSEKSKGKIILRYRFEKLDATKPSWWAKDQVEHGSLSPPLVHTCSECSYESQQIYLQGWMCLRPSCSMFWLLAPTVSDPVPHEPVEADLEYDPCFLKQLVRWPNEKHAYSLISNNAELSGLSIVGEDCSLAYWLGMVCPQCGRCNSRLSWTGWECGNTLEGCTWKREPPHIFIPAQSIRDPYFPLTAGYTSSRDTHLQLAKLEVTFKDNYRINKYTIPGIDGFVAHLIANKTVAEEEGGPDQMFEELQREDIGLRRRGLGSGMLKGESYTRHFLVNYGMPYKFIAATASKSFDGAARPINHTRTRLNWAAKSVLAETAAGLIAATGADEELARAVSEDVRHNIEEGWKEKEFNEVLALGYFEQQRINYHDDGEFGLGPTIATLSLGAPGTMRLRMKARHFNGVSTAGVYDDTLPLPGCAGYEARLAVQAELASLKATNLSTYRARLKTLPKELKLKSGGTARDAITLNLAHGDIVIMHGAQMQKYYEHSVDHAGKLRFALTCRYIEPGSLKEADRPAYEVMPDDGEYDGSKLPAAG